MTEAMLLKQLEMCGWLRLVKSEGLKEQNLDFFGFTLGHSTSGKRVALTCTHIKQVSSGKLPCSMSGPALCSGMT